MQQYAKYIFYTHIDAFVIFIDILNIVLLYITGTYFFGAHFSVY